MKFSVLINNHNYGPYVRESVESVLAQTHPAHEIIVVDDASTDDSLPILHQAFAANPKIKIISQSHQGQIAAIATGVENATGDIVCLMDSDDRYQPNYLSELNTHYQKRPCIDLTFCQVAYFGNEPFRQTKTPFLSPQSDYDYGYTALLMYFGSYFDNPNWIGNITSTLSLRIELARVLNLRETAQSFYILNQADYPIVVGASLLGARKYYLHQQLVEYRRHENNDSHKFAKATPLRAHLWHNDLIRFNHYKKRSGITDDLWKSLPLEMASVPNPSPLHLEHYEKLLLACQKRFAGPKPSLPRQAERTFRSWRKRLLGHSV